MIDNFDLLRPHLRFGNPDNFYFIQVLKRRKDNPGMARHNKHIRDFTVAGPEQFRQVQPKVIEYCEKHNARAYIRMNRRSFKQVTFFVLKYAADLIQSGHFFDPIKSAFSIAAGKTCFETGLNKTFLVDVDEEQLDSIQTIKAFFQDYFNGKYYGSGGPSAVDNYKLIEVPTVSGAHLLVSAFNVKLFADRFPNVEVHRDNPTILYSPDQK